MLEYNPPANYVEEQNKILAGISKADIDKTATKWIKLESSNILLVGDKAKILPGREKFGYEIIELDVNGKLKTGNEPLGNKLPDVKK